MMEISFYSDRKALSVVIMYLFYRLLKENVTKALIRHIYKHSPYHDIPRILSSDTSETRMMRAQDLVLLKIFVQLDMYSPF